MTETTETRRYPKRDLAVSARIPTDLRDAVLEAGEAYATLRAAEGQPISGKVNFNALVNLALVRFVRDCRNLPTWQPPADD